MEVSAEPQARRATDDAQFGMVRTTYERKTITYFADLRTT